MWYSPIRSATVALAIANLTIASASAQIFTRIDSSGLDASHHQTVAGSWADYDGDGDLDLTLATAGGDPILQYVNDGEGLFVPDTTSAFTKYTPNTLSVRWVDVDNDADLDLFVPTLDEVDLLFVNHGGGEFEERFDYYSTGARIASFADFDLDGDLDFVLTQRRAGDNLLFVNDGEGYFSPSYLSPTSEGDGDSTCAAWADINGDNYPDLFVGNTDEQTNLFFWNASGDGFERSEAGVIPRHASSSGTCSWVDVDNDLDLDLFVTNAAGGANALYENVGSSAFVEFDRGEIALDRADTQGHAWIDIDNDGDLDLYTTNRGSANRLYINDGSGELIESLNPILMPNDGDDISTSWADYDGDGDLDMFMARRFGSNDLYRNDGVTNAWLQIGFEGTDSNSFGVGAVVTVVAEIWGRVVTQYRLHSSGASNPQRGHGLHFGLGDAAEVTVQVEWPSGRAQSIEGVPVNQALVLRESDAGASPRSTASDDFSQAALVISAPFPNPVETTASLRIEGERSGRVNIRVVDVLGRTVVHREHWLSGAGGSEEIMIDLAGQPTGSFFIVATTPDGQRAVRSVTKVQ